MKKKRLREIVISMLSCGALARNNNPRIELIVDSFQNSERDLHYVGLIGKKTLKKGWDNGKIVYLS